MKPAALQALTIDELKQKEQELRRELFNLRFRVVTGELENPMSIRSVRKDIARVLTIMTEKSATSKK